MALVQETRDENVLMSSLAKRTIVVVEHLFKTVLVTVFFYRLTLKIVTIRSILPPKRNSAATVVDVKEEDCFMSPPKGFGHHSLRLLKVCMVDSSERKEDVKEQNVSESVLNIKDFPTFPYCQEDKDSMTAKGLQNSLETIENEGVSFLLGKLFKNDYVVVKERRIKVKVNLIGFPILKPCLEKVSFYTVSKGRKLIKMI